jgi:hypothetical protein
MMMLSLHNLNTVCEEASCFWKKKENKYFVNWHLFAQVMGLPRKKNYAGRWDVLIDKSTKCLNKLLEVSAGKKRNYIIDQVM